MAHRRPARLIPVLLLAPPAVLWLAASLVCRYLFPGLGLVGLLLQVALSIVLFLYLTYQKARS